MDGLRGLCFFAVYGYHAQGGAGGATLFKGGYAGVDVFFVLSGFLIAGILGRIDRPGMAALGQFYIDRCRRILPAFALTLVVVAAVWGLPDWPYHLAFLTNFRVAETRGWPGAPIGHFWTLAVEWQFYLFFPLLYLGCPRRLRPILLALGLIGCKISRYLLFPRLGPWATFTTPVAAEYLIWGAAFALLPRLARPTWPLLLVGLGISMVVTWVYWHAQVGVEHGYSSENTFILLGGSIDGLGAALIVYGLWNSTGVLPAALSFGPLAYVGCISYGLYLAHIPALKSVAMMPFLNTQGHRVQALSALLLTFGVAVASWHLVERPILRWRR